MERSVHLQSLLPAAISSRQHLFVSPFSKTSKDQLDSGLNAEISLGSDAAQVLKAMASHVLPPNSGLVGIALVVRSKDGPRFIFHYPPRLASTERREKPLYGTELDPTTPDASDAEDDSDEDDFDDEPSHVQRGLGRLSLGADGEGKKRHVSPWDGDDHFEDEEGVQIVPWEHVDAFTTKDLASILTPHRRFHKKQFHLTLDPLNFVTYPMYIRPDGHWKKVKKQKRKKKRPPVEVGTESSVASESVTTNGDKDRQDESDYEEVVEGGAKESAKPYDGSTAGSENGNDEGVMTMFNLVFIMNPPRLEALARVQDMFEHVAKDLNKALRYAQHYSNYVWRESELILTMKEKAREERRPMSSLWAKIIEKSSLASAIRDIYEAVSTNNIATVHFPSDPPVRLSVQIPKPFFLTVPPDVDEEAIPGVLITTANCLEDQEGEENPILNKHFALLLMDDEDKIMADIQADGGDLATPLLDYLRILQPTVSFAQTAQQHAISLSDIRLLAQHLIYYRRAIAIPPLHPRDTYIVSPNSPNRTLPTACATWTATFPLAPPLPTFLAALSLAPRPYKTFAPTKTHRPQYMSMLAWLLRNGWVTCLRTFALVIVWPEIRYEVDHALAEKRIQRAYDDAKEDALEERRALPLSPATMSSEAAAEKARLHRLHEKAKADQQAFQRRPKPVRTDSPSTNAAEHLLGVEAKIIRDPYRADVTDSLYLEAIGKRFKEERERKAWTRFARYFDGKEALEMVALREGMKRKEAWGLVVGFEEYLLTFRHW